MGSSVDGTAVGASVDGACVVAGVGIRVLGELVVRFATVVESTKVVVGASVGVVKLVVSGAFEASARVVGTNKDITKSAATVLHLLGARRQDLILWSERENQSLYPCL